MAGPGPVTTDNGATIDVVLLRRFGHVRAIGGALYFAMVAVLFVIYGLRLWPMLIGVVILAVATTAYFMQSDRHPRTAVIASLSADLVVLVGAVMFFGGTGSGLVLLYSIVVVSGGIMLGPSAATGFAGVACIVAGLQFVAEQAGLQPAVAFRPDTGDRVAILLASIAGLASVGYLTGAYSSRLHELLAISSADLAQLRSTGRRRRGFVRAVAANVTVPLRDLERLADDIERGSGAPAQPFPPGDPGGTRGERRLAADLRILSTRLQAGIEMLADVGIMDTIRDTRPEPILLARVVDDCLTVLAPRIGTRALTLDVPPIRVVGDRRGARRIVYNLIENVIEHTPEGTAFDVTVLINAGRGVLVVSDDGPGVPADAVPGMFRREFEEPAVGLPLVRELAEAMGAQVRYEQAADGGARFMVAFRLAPPAASSGDGDDEAPGLDADPSPPAR